MGASAHVQILTGSSFLSSYVFFIPSYYSRVTLVLLSLTIYKGTVSLDFASLVLEYPPYPLTDRMANSHVSYTSGL